MAAAQKFELEHDRDKLTEGNSIRIRFTWKGAEPPRRCETLGFPQTPKGITAAASLRSQVVQLIKHNALTDDKYSELFPNSKYSTARRTPTFAEYTQVWLDTREIVAGTRRNYKNVLNLYWMPHLALKPISAITPFELRRIVADTQWTSATTKRAALVRIRSVLASATEDGWLEKNPARGIDLPRKNKREIDPFTRDEAERIIAHLYETLCGRRVEIYAAYMEFAFFTGMRPGEIRALREEEIDTTQRIARVCRIVVDGALPSASRTGSPVMCCSTIGRCTHWSGHGRSRRKSRSRPRSCFRQLRAASG
ncbi:phage integrase central domain-containing protein [Stutzerimonas stutzeri]|uniref:phage integrase central domain-containing protein n=1 Tax=Stutzerimonas stutzeri TaxID=316 RepID=UPI0030140E84